MKIPNTEKSRKTMKKQVTITWTQQFLLLCHSCCIRQMDRQTESDIGYTFTEPFKRVTLLTLYP